MFTWFGRLDLAWKYALVFAAVLALTFTAGFIKVLLDRTRMNKHIKAHDLETDNSSRASSVDGILQMREKDEGDLFGIRAIEAGFFGGITQSEPNSPMVSRAASPAGSRNGSPAPINRIPYGVYNPSLASHQSFIQSQYNNYGGSHSSISSSILDLAQYGDDYGRSSISPNLRYSNSSSALIDHPATKDSVFSVLSPAPATYTPTSLYQISPSRLRPTQAELYGRRNPVSSNLPFNGQVAENFDSSNSNGCPVHNAAERASVGSNVPTHVSDRVSYLSTVSSITSPLEDRQESVIPEQAKLVDGPGKKGKKTIEVRSFVQPSMDNETNAKGAVIKTIKSGESRGMPAPKHARVAAPPLRLPLFQKKAIIGASNPEFDKFRRERMQSIIDGEEVKSFGLDPPARRIDQAHISAASPRTSFSFDYANSDGVAPEEKAFTAQPGSRHLSRRLYASGTYNPAGAPSTASTRSRS